MAKQCHSFALQFGKSPFLNDVQSGFDFLYFCAHVPDRYFWVNMSSNNIHTVIYGQRIPYSSFVMPAEAGIQSNANVSTLDPSLRWDDKMLFVEIDMDEILDL